MRNIFYILFLSSFIISCNNKIEKPNLVFFLADDLTNWDIACYGSVDSKTPNIDKLGQQGIKFQRCYQAAPMCSPTRHNIFTGLYPVKTGAYPNHTFAKEGTKSIVHYLKPLGYRVAQAGKRHINSKKVFPFEYLGADRNPDFNKVEGFLKDVKSSKEPFALMLCSNEPHDPWDKGDASQYNPEEITLPPHYVDTKETREAFCRYLAEINYLDGQVGRALELLEKYDFDENTLFVFASEQGNVFPFAKWTLYEAGVKSALIARMPKLIKAGTESEAIVDYSDILPTFIELAGDKAPSELDGESLVPLFNGKRKKVKDYSYSLQTTRGITNGSDYYGIRSIVSEDFRYIWNITPEVEYKNIENNGNKVTDWYKSWAKAAQTDETAKNIVRKNSFRPKEELYNIKNDKWCLVNLAANEEYAEVIKELKQELLKWMDECGDKGQQTELQAFEHQFNRKAK